MNLASIFMMIKKELLEIKKDRSIFVMTFILPIVMIVIYGYGLSIDIKPVKVAVCYEDNSQFTKEIVQSLSSSEYFDISYVHSIKQAQELLNNDEVIASIYIPNNLFSQIQHNRGQILINLNGSESQNAFLSLNYIKSSIIPVINKYLPYNDRLISYNVRNYFNEQNSSVHFLIPGQLIGIITLICCFISSISIAREFDRGTILALMSTNLSALEFTISKFIPYFLLSLLSSIISTIFCFITFSLPFYGSFIALCMLIIIYNFNCVFIGLFISALVKNQFLSSMMSVVFSFLPSILLSGVIFDLKAVPDIIGFVGNLLPATYAVSAIRICLLSGGSIEQIAKALLYIFSTGLLFAFLTYRLNKKILR